MTKDNVFLGGFVSGLAVALIFAIFVAVLSPVQEPSSLQQYISNQSCIDKGMTFASGMTFDSSKSFVCLDNRGEFHEFEVPS